MRQKLAIAPALVAALTLGALTVHTTASPAGAAAAPATWDLEAYGPKTGDDVVLKWNEQLLATIGMPISLNSSACRIHFSCLERPPRRLIL